MTSLVTLNKKLGPAAYDALYKKPKRKTRARALHFVQGNATLMMVTYKGTARARTRKKPSGRSASSSRPPARQVLVGGDTASLVDRLQSLERICPSPPRLS